MNLWCNPLAVPMHSRGDRQLYGPLISIDACCSLSAVPMHAGVGDRQLSGPLSSIDMSCGLLAVPMHASGDGQLSGPLSASLSAALGLSDIASL